MPSATPRRVGTKKKKIYRSPKEAGKATGWTASLELTSKPTLRKARFRAYVYCAVAQTLTKLESTKAELR